MPRQLTVDLGFNFNSQFFGGPLGKTPSQTFYPLQIGINDSNDNPVWPTQLAYGDRIRFKITDITYSGTQTPETVANTYAGSTPTRAPIAVYAAFANPNLAAMGAQTWPFTTQPMGVYQESISKDGTEPGLKFEGASSLVWGGSSDTNSAVFCAENPAWQVNRWHCQYNSNGDAYFTLVNSSMFVKTSFLVRVAQGQDTKEFVLDPEWFVGAGSG